MNRCIAVTYSASKPVLCVKEHLHEDLHRGVNADGHEVYWDQVVIEPLKAV